MKIHRRLKEPLRGRKGTYVRDLLLDLTVYVDTLNVEQFDALIDWYVGVCPQQRLSKYIIEENTIWDDVRYPKLLTNLGHAAAKAGAPMPFLAPVRKRLDDGRRYYVQFWDGQPTGSVSLSVRAMHRQDTGLHGFVRLTAPVDTDPDFLHRTALEWSDLLDICSGHGGLCFSYDQWAIDQAFDEIYALSRRFWGVDVEHLNGTLPRMKDKIKGVSWLTIVGDKFRTQPELAQSLEALVARDDLQIDKRSKASVIRVGAEPIIADQNRPTAQTDPYEAVASGLAPLILDEHPDFPGPIFEDRGNTLAWIRRFVEPSGWQ